MVLQRRNICVILRGQYYNLKSVDSCFKTSETIIKHKQAMRKPLQKGELFLKSSCLLEGIISNETECVKRNRVRRRPVLRQSIAECFLVFDSHGLKPKRYGRRTTGQGRKQPCLTLSNHIIKLLNS